RLTRWHWPGWACGSLAVLTARHHIPDEQAGTSVSLSFYGVSSRKTTNATESTTDTTIRNCLVKLKVF
ncbi:MAG: hypothetical protein WBN81_06695, partial [Gammaproteobacteria bacterium]